MPAVVPGGLPQNAAGFAREFVRLRDRLAPNQPELPVTDRLDPALEKAFRPGAND